MLLVLAAEPNGRRLGHRLLPILALWHHRCRSRRRLGLLDDRELDDIGLSRAEQGAECRKPFWRE